MFVGRVGLKGSVAFFKEKDSNDLAEKIVSICNDLKLYEEMSNNSKLEWNDLNLELKWADMINFWLSGQDHDLSRFSLKNIHKKT